MEPSRRTGPLRRTVADEEPDPAAEEGQAQSDLEPVVEAVPAEQEADPEHERRESRDCPGITPRASPRAETSPFGMTSQQTR